MKIKLNKEVETTYQVAKTFFQNTEGQYDFDCLNETTISNTQDFECVQNRRYFVTKIGRKGSLLYPGSEYQTKTEVGVYVIEMTWDFRHPTNFTLNKNNLSRTFKVGF